MSVSTAPFNNKWRLNWLLYVKSDEFSLIAAIGLAVQEHWNYLNNTFKSDSTHLKMGYRYPQNEPIR